MGEIGGRVLIRIQLATLSVLYSSYVVTIVSFKVWPRKCSLCRVCEMVLWTRNLANNVSKDRYETIFTRTETWCRPSARWFTTQITFWYHLVGAWLYLERRQFLNLGATSCKISSYWQGIIGWCFSWFVCWVLICAPCIYSCPGLQVSLSRRAADCNDMLPSTIPNITPLDLGKLIWNELEEVNLRKREGDEINFNDNCWRR